jgi:hypothetical protein
MSTVLAEVIPFEWPTEAEMSGFLELADTKAFAAWLWKTGEREVSKRSLEILYQEFCIHSRKSPLTLGQLQRQLKGAGVIPMKGKEERTKYRVLPRA